MVVQYTVTIFPDFDGLNNYTVANQATAFADSPVNDNPLGNEDNSAGNADTSDETDDDAIDVRETAFDDWYQDRYFEATNDGTIEIRSIAREPGFRTKLAVHSRDDKVDPVGACVGMKGSLTRSGRRACRAAR